MSDSKHTKKRVWKYILPVACCTLSFVLGGMAMAIWERKNAVPVNAPGNEITQNPAAGTPVGTMPAQAMPPDDTGHTPTPAVFGETPVLTAAPELSSSPGPEPTSTSAPEPTSSPGPKPTGTSAPEPSSSPDPRPSSTPAPEPSNTPAPEPSNTPAPRPSSSPGPASPTPKPAMSLTPESTKGVTPAATAMPSKTPSGKKPSEGKAPENTDSSGRDFCVSANGQLRVDGTQLVNQFGSPIVLRGVSTAGIAWFPNFATKDFMKTLRDEWGISVFRIAMYSLEGNDSYVNNPKWNKSKVCSLIDAAMELDLYVIVDWHILADGNPQTYQAQAMEFFDYIAGEYAGVPNVLYEICNEPNGNVSWNGNIKPYAQEVIPVIRKHSPDAIVIVGTPTWSQDVDVAADSPLEEENVMYALHFYAGTHKEWLRNRAADALRKGLPIFVSEWGTTDASGNGNVDTASSDAWLEFLEDSQISWCNWSLCNKAESSALLLPSAGDSGAMPDSVISDSGKYVKRKLLQYGSAGMPEGTPPSKEEESGSSKEQKPGDPPSATQPPAPTPTSAPAAAGAPADASGLVLLSYNENRTAISNTISPRIQLQNNTEGEVFLEDIMIRYYYTPESDAAQMFWCDYADVNGGVYRAVTGSVRGDYRSGARSCMEISFDASAGSLLPGESVSLQLRFTNEDWGDYDQSNDASFLPSASSWQENPDLGLIFLE